MRKHLHLDFEVASPAHLAGRPLRSLFLSAKTSTNDVQALAEEVEVLLRQATGHDEGMSLRLTISCVQADLSAADPHVLPTILSQVRLDEEAWLMFAKQVSISDFLYDALYGPKGNLLPALRAQIDWMTNHYAHEDCEEVWSAEWSCACDEECPSCGAAIEPYSTDILEQLVEHPGTPGIFGLFPIRDGEATVDPESEPQEERRAGRCSMGS